MFLRRHFLRNNLADASRANTNTQLHNRQPWGCNSCFILFLPRLPRQQQQTLQFAAHSSKLRPPGLALRHSAGLGYCPGPQRPRHISRHQRTHLLRALNRVLPVEVHLRMACSMGLQPPLLELPGEGQAAEGLQLILCANEGCAWECVRRTRSVKKSTTAGAHVKFAGLAAANSASLRSPSRISNSLRSVEL